MLTDMLYSDAVIARALVKGEMTMYEVIEHDSLFYVMTESDEDGFQRFIGPVFATRDDALAWIAESL